MRRWKQAMGVIVSFAHQPTLNDVFLELTGTALRD